VKEYNMTYTCPCGKTYGTGTEDDKKSNLKRYCPGCTKQLVDAHGKKMGVSIEVKN